MKGWLFELRPLQEASRAIVPRAGEDVMRTAWKRRARPAARSGEERRTTSRDPVGGVVYVANVWCPSVECAVDGDFSTIEAEERLRDGGMSQRLVTKVATNWLADGAVRRRMSGVRFDSLQYLRPGWSTAQFPTDVIGGDTPSGS